MTFLVETAHSILGRFVQTMRSFFRRRNSITASDIQRLLNMTGSLMVEVQATSAVLAHLVADSAKAKKDPERWLRQLSTDVHASINVAREPEHVLREIEMFRTRVDAILNAASMLAKN